MAEHSNAPGEAGAETPDTVTTDILPEDEVVDVPPVTKDLANGSAHPSAYLPEVSDWDEQD